MNYNLSGGAGGLKPHAKWAKEFKYPSLNTRRDLKVMGTGCPRIFPVGVQGMDHIIGEGSPI